MAVQSHAQDICLNLRIAMFLRPQIEGDRRDLIHLWDGESVFRRDVNRQLILVFFAAISTN